MPPAIHHSAIANRKAFQVKKNKAAIAPIWKAVMETVVIQTIGSENVLSCVKGCVVSIQMPRS
jgi:uncharacterized protein (DUF983 family)